MKDLQVIENGALLIHNGIIREAGPSRRVENLLEARKAHEIDAAGKIVMPAFVDPDAALVTRPPSGKRSPQPAVPTALRLASRRRLESDASALAADWTRNGVLSLGAHTGDATDLREIAKILSIHRDLQSKPVRIRSIFSIRSPGERPADEDYLNTLTQHWLPAVRRRKLAAIAEFTANGVPSPLDLCQVRAAATAASVLGYSIRLRAGCLLSDEARQLALHAGAVSVVAPTEGPTPESSALADIGCVHVVPIRPALGEEQGPSGGVRRLIDAGCSVALASSSGGSGKISANPQFLLHLACALYGMSIEEAIVACTYNAACSLRLSHSIGSLVPGKHADLLVVDLPDYRDLPARAGGNDIELVIRSGRPIYRRGGLILD